MAGPHAPRAIHPRQAAADLARRLKGLGFDIIATRGTCEVLERPGFDSPKRKLLWMQNGGDLGLEIDEIRITPTEKPSPSPSLP